MPQSSTDLFPKHCWPDEKIDSKLNQAALSLSHFKSVFKIHLYFEAGKKTPAK